MSFLILDRCAIVVPLSCCRCVVVMSSSHPSETRPAALDSADWEEDEETAERTGAERLLPSLR